MLPILLALGVLGLLWGVFFLRRAGLVGGCLATIGIGSCLGHSFFHVSVITLDRMLLAVVAAMYVWARSVKRLAPTQLRKSDVTLIAFMGVLLVSVFTHNWRLDGAQPLARYLFFYLAPFVVYWIASRCELTASSQLWILQSFAVFGVYLGVTGVFEVLGLRPLVFPRYIMTSDFVEFFGRARGPYLNPIGNGLYMTAGLLASLLWLPHLRSVHRPVALAFAGIAGVGVICTLTRSVWLGAAVSVIAWGALLLPRQHRGRLLVTCFLAGVAALVAKGESFTKFKRDANVSAEEMAESAKLRPILAAFAYEIVQDYPLTGVGLGQYFEHNVDYLSKRTFDLPMHRAIKYVQHNVFLSLLTETGLLGMGLFCTVLAFWLSDAWRLWHSSSELWLRQLGLMSFALLMCYLVNAMFHEMSLIPMVNMLVYFAAGISRRALSAAEDCGAV